MRRFAPASLLVSAALLLLGAAPAAASWRAACVPGQSFPRCTWWSGKVVSVNDGDTIDVAVPGDGRPGATRVRITGIQAMEQTVYSTRSSRRRGYCHAVAATERLERLIRASRGYVRLAAQSSASSSFGRVRRSVWVRIGGRWHDAGRILLAGGHALWLPNTVEDHFNRAYSVVAERAAARGLRLWDRDACGPGPSQASPLNLVVNWDADGSDFENVNGEWVRIENLDPVNAVPLGNWTVRDSALRQYRFPAHVVVPPGGSLRMHVGRGPDTEFDLHWGLRRPVFENTTEPDIGMGDGAYLFDPDGDLRAWMTYPCRLSCQDPAAGVLQVDAEPTGDEYILVRNTGPSPVDLGHVRLEAPPYAYTFPRGTVLGAGQTLRVDVNGSPDQDTDLERHWGFDGSILTDDGDVVRLRTYRAVPLACDSWGYASCS